MWDEPGRTRPARPARCLAEALSTQHSTRARILCFCSYLLSFTLFPIQELAIRVEFVGIPALSQFCWYALSSTPSRTLNRSSSKVKHAKRCHRSWGEVYMCTLAYTIAY